MIGKIIHMNGLIMKIPDEIVEFCHNWFSEHGCIGPYLLCRKFKIKPDLATKILKFLKYPENVLKNKKVDTFKIWCEANGVPIRRPRGKMASRISVRRLCRSQAMGTG